MYDYGQHFDIKHVRLSKSEENFHFRLIKWNLTLKNVDTKNIEKKVTTQNILIQR